MLERLKILLETEYNLHSICLVTNQLIKNGIYDNHNFNKSSKYQLVITFKQERQPGNNPNLQTKYDRDRNERTAEGYKTSHCHT